MHQRLQGATFHVEHINPRAEGGPDELANLVLACPSCNLHKAGRTKAVDPLTGAAVSLYHPIQQTWSEHFRLVGYRIEGLSAVGRATVLALDMNHARRQLIRCAEEKLSLYFPSTGG